MSTNTLNNRSTGQTILDNFFNDIHSALDGDFVGRGATGIPTSGQNLGTLALPWGALYCSTINLNGSTLDTTKIVSPANRIVSGKKRSTSNQPAFITPNGAAASFVLAGATTNLVTAINGAAVSVTTDITKSGLTLAPSSNNTATVNDTAAASQTDTRKWGEYWSKKITMTSAGSNITALVGKFASFKIVQGGTTEYFTAFVESSTLLSHCFRGYFYDSSLNPINRIVFSNSATITLMSQGFVYITNDGTTVDVSYTNPTYSSTSPSSPATGDYWFDMVNLTWKRYDGASFNIINRTLIGMVIIDTANCVGARSFDFYNNYSPFSSVELEVSTTSTLRLTKQFQRISVAGNDIQFGTTLATWTGSANYPSATDYYAAFTLSTNYFMYVKDDGTCVMTDIEPYYRSDLYGYYHPHNPWRCVAWAPTDGSTNFNLLVSQVDLKKAGAFSEIYVNGTPSLGSLPTKCYSYPTIQVNNGGQDLLYKVDTVNGDTVTVLTDGVYCCAVGGGGSNQQGISVSSSSLTTSITSLTYAQGQRSTGAANGASSTIILNLKAGDIVRAHSDAGGTIGTTQQYFQVRRIA